MSHIDGTSYAALEKGIMQSRGVNPNIGTAVWDKLQIQIPGAKGPSPARTVGEARAAMMNLPDAEVAALAPPNTRPSPSQIRAQYMSSPSQIRAQYMSRLADTPDHWVIMQQGPHRNWFVPPELHDFLTKQAAPLSDITSPVWENVRTGWKAYTKWWSMWTLSAIPGFHLRNEVGNLAKNALADVWRPQYGAMALYTMGASPEELALWTVTHRTGTTSTLSALDESMKRTGTVASHFNAMLREAEKDGAGLMAQGAVKAQAAEELDRLVARPRAEGFQRLLGLPRELAEQLAAVGARPGAKPWEILQSITPLLTTSPEKSVILKLGSMTGSFFEEWARRWHFLEKRLHHGLGEYAAAQSVFDHLYDYQDLSRAMQAAKTSTFPFLTWYLNSIPQEFIKTALRPQRAARVQALIHAVEAQATEDEERQATEEGRAPRPLVPLDLLSAWQQKGAPMRTRTIDATGKAGVRMLGGTLPIFDADRLLRLGEEAMGFVHPLWKFAVGMGTGKNLFRPTGKGPFDFSDISGFEEPELRQMSNREQEVVNPQERFGSRVSPYEAFTLDSVLPGFAAWMHRMNFGQYGQAGTVAHPETAIPPRIGLLPFRVRSEYRSRLDPDNPMSGFVGIPREYGVDVIDPLREMEHRLQKNALTLEYRMEALSAKGGEKSARESLEMMSEKLRATQAHLKALRERIP
jgi:hypothetical protein